MFEPCLEVNFRVTTLNVLVGAAQSSISENRSRPRHIHAPHTSIIINPEQCENEVSDLVDVGMTDFFEDDIYKEVIQGCSHPSHLLTYAWQERIAAGIQKFSTIHHMQPLKSSQKHDLTFRRGPCHGRLCHSNPPTPSVRSGIGTHQSIQRNPNTALATAQKLVVS